MDSVIVSQEPSPAAGMTPFLVFGSLVVGAPHWAVSKLRKRYHSFLLSMSNRQAIAGVTLDCIRMVESCLTTLLTEEYRDGQQQNQ